MAGNFVVANEIKHQRRRENPSRPRLLLREAVQDAGLKVIGWEHMVQGDKYAVWYDALVELPNGTQAAIFLMDEKAKSKGNPFNVTARQRKLEYAKEQGMPFLEVWPDNKTYLRAQIEIWLMTLGKQPQRTAGNRPPRRVEPIRRKIRHNRVG